MKDYSNEELAAHHGKPIRCIIRNHIIDDAILIKSDNPYIFSICQNIIPSYSFGGQRGYKYAYSFLCYDNAIKDLELL